MRFILLTLFAVALLPSMASAYHVELRAHGGVQFINPDQFNRKLKSLSIKELYIFPEVSGDFILRIPNSPFGLGGRYGYHGLKMTAADGTNSSEAEMSVRRISPLLAIRFAETDKYYFGVVGTYGVAHQTTILLKTTPLTLLDYNEAKVTSWSGAMDIGFKMGPLFAGVEAGAQEIWAKEIKGPSGTADFDLFFNGFYFLLTVGAGI